MGYEPRAIAGDGRNGNTAILAGSFLTAGASAPTWGGDVVSVSREVTVGGTIFFRVTVQDSTSWDMNDLQNALVLGVGYGASEVLQAAAASATLTIDGGAVANGRTEFDVILRDDTDTDIDTAGITVSFHAVVSA